MNDQLKKLLVQEDNHMEVWHNGDEFQVDLVSKSIIIQCGFGSTLEKAITDMLENGVSNANVLPI